AQRLRADQIFDNVLVVLDANEPPLLGRGISIPGIPVIHLAGPRQRMVATFGYDPSNRRDEVQSSIPQALTLMNEPTIAGALHGTGNTMLARKLTSIKDDSVLVQELYL